MDLVKRSFANITGVINITFPALVMLKPLQNTAIRHIAISTLNLRFSQDDRGPAMVRMEVAVFYTDVRCPTMMRLETSIH